jgi:hypothetical protein
MEKNAAREVFGWRERTKSRLVDQARKNAIKWSRAALRRRHQHNASCYIQARMRGWLARKALNARRHTKAKARAVALSKADKKYQRSRKNRSWMNEVGNAQHSDDIQSPSSSSSSSLVASSAPLVVWKTSRRSRDLQSLTFVNFTRVSNINSNQRIISSSTEP